MYVQKARFSLLISLFSYFEIYTSSSGHLEVVPTGRAWMLLMEMDVVVIFIFALDWNNCA